MCISGVVEFRLKLRTISNQMNKEKFLNWIADNYPIVIGLVGVLFYGVWARQSALEEYAMQNQLARLQSATKVSTLGQTATNEYKIPRVNEQIMFYGGGGAMLGCATKSARDTGKDMIDLGLRSDLPSEFVLMLESGDAEIKQWGLEYYLNLRILRMYIQDISQICVFVAE